jgi:glycosyltransferase involved in cell wall biosynthesis
MRILMLAWRDIMNPKKGGAEIVTDIYLKDLANMGHDVFLFSSRFRKCIKTEKHNGYTIIRDGGELSVYLKGLMYAFKNKHKYDKIIDQVNTIPFFTPLLIPNNKRIAFFHQLCLNVWFYEMPWFLAWIGYIMEHIYLKLYLNTKAFVVSDSTKKDLIKHAWMKSDNILILDNQINFKVLNKIPKKEKNAFCFCGRLVKSKRCQDTIKAISLVPNSKLYIIGDGSYRNKLEKLVNKLNVHDRVTFLGRLTFSERNKIMGKCKAIIVTSVREGWGLIVTEANANGTIAITYDIPGLRDANKTGIICKKNNPDNLSQKIRKVLKEDANYLTLKALNFAKEHANWEKQVVRLEKWMD